MAVFIVKRQHQLVLVVIPHTHLNNIGRGGISIGRLRKQEGGRRSHGKVQEIDTNVSFDTSKEENTIVFLGTNHIAC